VTSALGHFDRPRFVSGAAFFVGGGLFKRQPDSPVRPELVEGRHRGFDKLNPNGIRLPARPAVPIPLETTQGGTT
jgi:hypothetical protein